MSFNILLASAVLICFVLNGLYILTFSASKILCPLGEHANNKKNESILSQQCWNFFTLVISATPVNIGKAAWMQGLVLPLRGNFPEFSRPTYSTQTQWRSSCLNGGSLWNEMARGLHHTSSSPGKVLQIPASVRMEHSHRCWLDLEPINMGLLQGHLTREWMSITSTPTNMQPLAVS